MAKTPHSSWNLSNIVLEGLFPAVSESADASVHQRLPPVGDDDPVFHRTADCQSSHAMSGRDGEDARRVSRGNQHPRRTFVKQQKLRAQVRIELDLRADTGR